jgi:hypothetical protein
MLKDTQTIEKIESILVEDGTASGLIRVANIANFRNLSKVQISSSTQPTITYQIKSIFYPDYIRLGPVDNNLHSYTNVSNYITLDLAKLTQEEQTRPQTNISQIARYIYEEEPVIADRVIQVNEKGRLNNRQNPSFSSVVHNNSILAPNPDGSLNVVVVEGGLTTKLPLSMFDTVTAVPSGVDQNLFAYVVPLGKYFTLDFIEVGGDNIAKYEVFINATLNATKRTYFGASLCDIINYKGFILNEGDSLRVQVSHNRPFLGSFEIRVFGFIADI